MMWQACVVYMPPLRCTMRNQTSVWSGNPVGTSAASGPCFSCVYAQSPGGGGSSGMVDARAGCMVVKPGSRVVCDAEC
jgi:hypothetical protein